MEQERISDYEQMVYWYGKAIEKINKQSKIIKRQSVRIEKLRLQLEEEKIKRRKRALDRINRGSISTINAFIEGGVFLNDEKILPFCEIWERFCEFCSKTGEYRTHPRTLSQELYKRFEKIRKSNGVWFKIKC